MPSAPPAPSQRFELRPGGLVETLFHLPGESTGQRRKRILAAVPVAIGLLALQGLRARREAISAVLVMIALVIVVLVVGAMVLSQRRQRIAVEGDTVLVRGLLRRQRVPTAQLVRAETVDVNSGTRADATTFLLDADGRSRVRLSHQLWRPTGVDQLCERLGISRTDHTSVEPALGFGETNRRYPGSYGFAIRHLVFTTIVLVLLVILVATVALVWWERR